VTGSTSGGCACGGVRFEISQPTREAGYCHCTRCQKRTGGGSSVQARIDHSIGLTLLREDDLRWWRHPDGGFDKGFCGTCGSHLFSRNPEDHSQMSIRMAAFDGDPGVRPSWRTFVDYAAPWEPVPDDGLQRYAEGRPRE